MYDILISGVKRNDLGVFFFVYTVLPNVHHDNLVNICHHTWFLKKLFSYNEDF